MRSGQDRYLKAPLNGFSVFYMQFKTLIFVTKWDFSDIQSCTKAE